MFYQSVTQAKLLGEKKFRVLPTGVEPTCMSFRTPDRRSTTELRDSWELRPSN